MDMREDVMTGRVLSPLSDLWLGIGGEASALRRVVLTGCGTILPSSFHVGVLAQASIAACTLAASEVARLRNGGDGESVSVDLRHAVAEFRSERYLRLKDGGEALDLWDEISGAYHCGDGRWVRLHTNFQHHRDGTLKLLGCEHDRAAVQKALLDWKAEDFEHAAAERGLVVAMMRSFEEWPGAKQF